MIKIVSWNIQQGGGSRVLEICDVLVGSGAQIIGLNEFKNNPVGEKIRTFLLKKGYIHQVVGAADPKTNSVFVASKIPFDACHFTKTSKSHPHSIVKASFAAFDLFVMYLPHKKKHNLFENIVDEMKQNDKGIFIGDFNSGKQFIDQRGDSFWYSEYFDIMEENQYLDAWRLKQGDLREFSWYSHQGNGYRYDHIYLHKNIAPVVSACYYEHDWRMRKISDHSAMILELG